MNVSDELTLSFYREIAQFRQERITIVQNIETKKIYVQKRLTVFNKDIFDFLRKNPVPKTPRIYEVVQDGDTLIVIEEYIHGETLQEMLNSGKSFSESEVNEIALQLTSIIKYLHHLVPPIIHRDIKPSNLMLCTDGTLKLLDFNATIFMKSNRHQDTTLLGTSGYAAPEQYGFGASGPLTDIYAIGVLMNVLLTGCIPSENPATGKLAFIIEKCTQLDPKNRFGNIDQLIDALTTVKEEKPYPLPPYGKKDTDPTSKGQYRHSWQKFLPPGFRSLSPMHMLPAICGYVLIIFLSLSLNGDPANSPDTICTGIEIFLSLTAIVFFSANYLGIHSKVPLAEHSNRLVRWCAILFYDILILVVFIFLTALLELIFSV